MINRIYLKGGSNVYCIYIWPPSFSWVCRTSSYSGTVSYIDDNPWNVFRFIKIDSSYACVPSGEFFLGILVKVGCWMNDSSDAPAALCWHFSFVSFHSWTNNKPLWHFFFKQKFHLIICTSVESELPQRESS